MLDGLGQDLAAFNTFDLLAKVGALNLDPRNASRQVSLEALANLTAAIGYRPEAPPISLNRMRSLLLKHLGEDSEPGRHDNPAANLFTEELVWGNGPYTVFPGTWEGGRDCLTWLLKCAVSGRLRVNGQGFRDDTIRAASMCLSVSNEIARKTGMGRGISPKLERELVVPYSNAMHIGSNAVTFSKADLLALHGPHSYFDETIGPLTIDAGHVDWEEYQTGFGDLHQKPLVRFGDEYVVPIPSSLLHGLRHRILGLALEHGVLSELSHSFRDVIWTELEVLLRMSGSAPAQDGLPNPCPTTFREGLFTLDSDKALYVQLATDDWEGSTERIGPARWDVSSLLMELDHRNSEVVEHLETSGLASARI